MIEDRTDRSVACQTIQKTVNSGCPPISEESLADPKLKEGPATMTKLLQSADWEHLLLRYQRDTVDKALEIAGRGTKPMDSANEGEGKSAPSSGSSSSISHVDYLAAALGEIPLPKSDSCNESRALPNDGRFEIRHPLSAEPKMLECLQVKESDVRDTAAEIVNGIDDPRKRFHALWRLLPERFDQRLATGFARLPADLRVPDHTLFHRADIAAGICACNFGSHGGAFLSVSLGPVQPFIAAARTVRDLWSGGAILSWLTFKALQPVIEHYGPTALVFPMLRGNPLMDRWLRDDLGLGNLISRPQEGARRAPSIPNRFVAIVPWGPDGRDGQIIANLCEDSVRCAWRRLSKEVHDTLDPKFAAIDMEWAKRWHCQVEEFFEIRSSVVPALSLDDQQLTEIIDDGESFETLWPDAAAVRGLAAAIPAPDRTQLLPSSSGRWQAQMAASARIMEAQRTIRHVPQVCEESPSPAKCSLLGSFEQMGPDNPEDGRQFWRRAQKINVDGVRLRSGERFSALALCKRFAAPIVLRRELDLDDSQLKFPDTATIAAEDWLRDAGIDVPKKWNGRWLHQNSQIPIDDDEDPAPTELWNAISAARNHSSPPSYYAILNMDADHMGRWLNGGRGPRLKEILHPEIRAYFEQFGETGLRGLNARRPTGPTVHAAIGEALSDFASHAAPAVIKEHSGTAIYSGGDDILALMPARRSAHCAQALNRAFCGCDASMVPGATALGGRSVGAMGKDATMSAGIAFVHIKEDLRIALDAARDAEATAKRLGRNAVAMHFMRRSGEHQQTVVSWKTVNWFQELVTLFEKGATDRWTYRLRTELPTLIGTEVPEPAIDAEIRRIVDRARDNPEMTEEVLTGATAQEWWRRFKDAERCRHASVGERLTAFVTVCQGAAFVARGGDD